jgi:hypothetical protein
MAEIVIPVLVTSIILIVYIISEIIDKNKRKYTTRSLSNYFNEVIDTLKEEIENENEE